VSFAKSGSFLSVVNDAIYIDKSSGKLVIYYKSFKFPARTTLSELPEKIGLDEYDINKHIQALIDSKSDAGKFSL